YHHIDRSEHAWNADLAVIALATPTNQPLHRPPSYRLPRRLLNYQCIQKGEFFIFDLKGRCLPFVQGKPCRREDLERFSRK
ncbi:MAG: hypothetical protein RMJ84_13605, partial [Sandaracinaceae bacterium]|nr:hypothetical protein [Sandaracinaceae bacterium]